MRALALPVVVVARSGLGTINHTLLTVQAIRTAGLEVAGVVMNGPRKPANKQAIEEFGGVRVLAELEPLSELTPVALRRAYNELFGRIGETSGFVRKPYSSRRCALAPFPAPTALKTRIRKATAFPGPHFSQQPHRRPTAIAEPIHSHGLSPLCRDPYAVDKTHYPRGEKASRQDEDPGAW